LKKFISFPNSKLFKNIIKPIKYKLKIISKDTLCLLERTAPKKEYLDFLIRPLNNET